MHQRSLRQGAALTKRPITLTFAALALAGLLGACSGGGSDDSGASTTSAPDLSAEEEAALATEVEWNQCMRDNGIEGLPDPQVNDDGFLLVGFPVVLPEDWNAAQEACQYIHDEAAPTEDASGDAATGWERVVPGGDCKCADGSEFAFWERRADPTKVVLFLDGGGACSDATSCAFTGLSAGGEAATTTGASGARIRRRRAGSSTSPRPTTRSPTTRSSTCRPAPVTCTSATPPGSTRRS